MCACVSTCAATGRDRSTANSAPFHRNMQSPMQRVTPHQTTTRCLFYPSTEMPRLAFLPLPVPSASRLGWQGGMGSGGSTPLHPKGELQSQARPFGELCPAGHKGFVAPWDTSLRPGGCSCSQAPEPPQAREGRGQGSLSLPPAQQHQGMSPVPARLPAQREATPVTLAFVSKDVCWDTARDHPCAQAEGCQAPHGSASPWHLPPMGRGEAQAASWI